LLEKPKPEIQGGIDMAEKPEQVVSEEAQQPEGIVGSTTTKAKQIVDATAKTAEGVMDESRNPFLGALHKVLLASIGAVALAQEEIEDFVNKLVERGEIAERDGKALVSDLMARRKKEAEKAEKQMDGRVEEFLGRMNVPTKSDIDELSSKITELTEKIDSLQ
jgi:poly(hydroxyalkanoate) granule-associated protein